MIADAGVGPDLGVYRIEGALPGTAIGAMFRARELADGRLVALEILADGVQSPDAVADRLTQYTRRLNQIGHPHIATVHGTGVERGVAYVAWQLTESLDLAVLADRLGGLSFRRATQMLAQVADALDAAHAEGIVHGSLESTRVLVSGDESDNRALVSGLGLVAVLEGLGGDRDERPAGIAPGYVAPERIRGERATPAADVYALGCVYFNALTGSEPFVGTDEAGVLEGHLREAPPVLRASAPELPPALQEVLERALAKDPAQRFGSAGELARAATEARDRPDAEAEREAERRRVIVSWERSLAAGAAGWSPENPVLGPQRTSDAPAVDATTSEPPRAAPPAPARERHDPADSPSEPQAGESPDRSDLPDEPSTTGVTASPAAQSATKDGPSTTRPPHRARRRGKRIRALALAVTVAGVAAVGVLVVTDDDDARDGNPARTPAPSPSRDIAGGARAGTDWPARDGYTAVIAIAPASADGTAARGRARAAARRGYQAGVLESSDYPNLQPNLLVSFAGVYDSRTQAARAAEQLRRQGIAGSPYVRFVDGGG